MREETTYANRRNTDWSTRKEIAGVVKGGEKGDAEAAVGHGVEEAVACRRQKEIRPQGESTQAWNSLPKCEEHN